MKGLDRAKGEKIKKIYSSSKPFLLDCLIGCLSSEQSQEDIAQNLGNMGINLGEGVYLSIAVEIQQSGCGVDEDHFELFLEMEKALKAMPIHCEAFFSTNLYIYICCIDTEDAAQAVSEVLQGADAIKKLLDASFVSDYSIGIGQETVHTDEIPYSVKTAREACFHRHRLGNGQIIYINDVEPKRRKGEYSFIRQGEFITAIKVGNEDKMAEMVNKIFNDIVIQGETLHTAKRVCLELIVSAARAIYEIGQNPNMLFDKTDLWTVINRCEAIQQLKDLVINSNKVVISQLFHTHISKNRSIIEKAKKIIDETTDTKISLETVAEKAFISPCYLSLIFSKETGMTFKEYLIQSRIARAKLLLLSPEYKIYQVAKLVGYADARYFSDLFRRYEGMTPMEYRKNHIQ